MSTDASPNWEKSKKLPLLKTGLHNGFPYSEDFPRRSQGGTYELRTSWGEVIKGAVVGNHKTFNTVTDPPYWDLSRCDLNKNSRAAIGGKRLDENHVAGWKRER